MRFQSTRGGLSGLLGFADAFAAGLAPDGGLYVPESLPDLTESILSGAALASDVAPPDYSELAFRFFRLFDTDHDPAELEAIITRSHAAFDTPENAAPLRQLDERLFVLELFHGPTLAFKDFGLQLVGNLFEDQIKRTGRAINVLGATSGDTGSAAIHGLANKAGVRVFILYPKGRISPLQERQMTCTGADNIFPISIEGSFDEAQRIVKELFGDLAFKDRVGLSAVNSINLARVLAQTVYYLHAFLRLPAPSREGLAFAVPTGNFGNVFAAWLGSRMGLPADRLVMATNENDILHRFFTSGVYQPGSVHASLAPSMDIQAASNFERFLFYQLAGDARRTAAMMDEVEDRAFLEIPDFDPGILRATRSADADILANIRQVRERYDYIVDPHTACAFQEIDPSRNTIVLATAHPAKFPDTLEKAIGVRPIHATLESLKSASPVTHESDSTARAVREFVLAHAAA